MFHARLFQVEQSTKTLQHKSLRPFFALLILAIAVPLSAAETPPTVLGHPESCLTCHKQTEGLGQYHDPASIGCASCHGGVPAAMEKKAAHQGMRLIPGNLSDAQASCGASGCHPEAPARVAQSLMTTMAGVVALDRRVFGEVHPAPHAVTALTHSTADSHLRTLCASCHLGAPKTETGPITQESRGGGCNACHLNYASKQPITKAARAGKAALRHPALSINAGDDHCFGCHSRSGRISLSYRGLAEVIKPFPRGARLTRLEDGRRVRSMPADVHARRMQCIDCHTVGEVMGDGVRHASKTEALQVACTDCHTKAPSAAGLADLSPEEQRILIVRGRSLEDRYVRTRQNAALVGTTVRDGKVTTLPRAGGGPLIAREATTACTAAAHTRLTCESCHTAWAPRCNGCHTRFDPASEGYDLLADRPVRGDWLETAGDYRADAPTLGIRTNRDGAEQVTPFVPGMILEINRSPARRLFAPLAPHTISKQSRSCASCHADPSALGYGRGKLSFAAAGTQGTWRFSAAEPLAQDGLPADAWIGFLTGTGGDTLRPETRAFSTGEQHRILRVGACLTCHAHASPVMTAYLADPLSNRNRMGPRCVAPAQQGVAP